MTSFSSLEIGGVLPKTGFWHANLRYYANAPPDVNAACQAEQRGLAANHCISIGSKLVFESRDVQFLMMPQ